MKNVTLVALAWAVTALPAFAQDTKKEIEELKTQLANKQAEVDALRKELDLLLRGKSQEKDALGLARSLTVVKPGSPGLVLSERANVKILNRLEGKVTAVADEIGLVVISIGKDDGVREGDEFTVTRGGDLVAQIQIDRTDRRWSAGRITSKKGQPRIADEVSNPAFVSAPRTTLLKPAVVLSPSSTDEIRALRKELDEVRSQVRALSDTLVPSFRGAGITVEDLPEELRTHLGVPQGLIVRRIREGSSAEKAGLLANGVIPNLTEAEALRAIESGGALKIIRRGQPATLGEAKKR